MFEASTLTISQRESFDSSICGTLNRTRTKHFLANLVGTQVSVYFVTPLTNFSFKPNDVKALSKEFSMGVDSFKPKTKGSVRIGNQTCVRFVVKLGRRLLYNSYLFSIFEKKAKSPTVAQLPFMCVTSDSQKRLRAYVQKFIEKRFLCTIRNCCMSDSQMRWLLGISLQGTLKKGSNTSLSVHLQHPSLSDVTFGMEWSAACLEQVWTACSKSDDDSVVTVDSIMKFVSVLNEHQTNTYGLDSSSFILRRISLRDVVVSQDDTLTVDAKPTNVFYAIFYFLFLECVQNNPNLKPDFLRKLVPF